MGHLGREVQPIAGVEGEKLLEFGQVNLQQAGDDPQNTLVKPTLAVMNVPGLGFPGVRLQPFHPQQQDNGGSIETRPAGPVMR
jgi:hypothetical protein